MYKCEVFTVNNDNKTKIHSKKEETSSTNSNKTPFILFLIGVLLCILIFKINETNKYLKIIAENSSISIETETKDENYDSVLNVFTEEPTKQEDILQKPNYESTEPTDSTETVTQEDATTDTKQGKTYVINISSKKIHKPDCSFVGRTKEENKNTVVLSDEQLKDYINNGYQICKTCGGK